MAAGSMSSRPQMGASSGASRTAGRAALAVHLVKLFGLRVIRLHVIVRDGPSGRNSAVVANLAEGTKCARCWQVLEEVRKSAAHPLICRRCEEAVSA